MSLRTQVFMALDNAVTNGYGNFCNEDEDVVARDLIEYDSELEAYASAHGASEDALIPLVREWQATNS